MIDWNEVWRLAMLGTGRIRPSDTTFWDNLAESRSAGEGAMSDLTVAQLERITVEPEHSVLEIGPGDGRLTLPLARKVERITAVEPSERMLRLLHDGAIREGLNNITFLQCPWEDVEDVEKHDVVLASFSIMMPDLEEGLLKMDALAMESVYLFLSAEFWIPEEIQSIAYGTDISAGLSDLLIVYNMLHGTGILANVEIIEHRSERAFETMEEAIEMFTRLYEVPEGKREELEKWLDSALCPRDGRMWLTRPKRLAMVWWRK
ncbi:MAG: class I SAM-dependent methyltransferase [Methanomassiliicoccales archaeon]